MSCELASRDGPLVASPTSTLAARLHVNGLEASVDNAEGIAFKRRLDDVHAASVAIGPAGPKFALLFLERLPAEPDERALDQLETLCQVLDVLGLLQMSGFSAFEPHQLADIVIRSPGTLFGLADAWLESGAHESADLISKSLLNNAGALVAIRAVPEPFDLARGMVREFCLRSLRGVERFRPFFHPNCWARNRHRFMDCLRAQLASCTSPGSAVSDGFAGLDHGVTEILEQSAAAPQMWPLLSRMLLGQLSASWRLPGNNLAALTELSVTEIFARFRKIPPPVARLGALHFHRFSARYDLDEVECAMQIENLLNAATTPPVLQHWFWDPALAEAGCSLSLPEHLWVTFFRTIPHEMRCYFCACSVGHNEYQIVFNPTL